MTKHLQLGSLTNDTQQRRRRWSTKVKYQSVHSIRRFQRMNHSLNAIVYYWLILTCSLILVSYVLHSHDVFYQAIQQLTLYPIPTPFNCIGAAYLFSSSVYPVWNDRMHLSVVERYDLCSILVQKVHKANMKFLCEGIQDVWFCWLCSSFFLSVSMYERVNNGVTSGGQNWN